MIAPHLIELSIAELGLESLRHAGLTSDDYRAFSVTQAGEFGGRSFAVGDVLLCAASGRVGIAVIRAGARLRPRLGTIRGGHIWGELGEPCHPARWTSAGTVCVVLRPVGAAWVVVHVPAAAAPPRRVSAPVVRGGLATVGHAAGRTRAQSSTLGAAAPGAAASVNKGSSSKGTAAVVSAEPQLSLFLRRAA